jgi:hypothetical protein
MAQQRVFWFLLTIKKWNKRYILSDYSAKPLQIRLFETSLAKTFGGMY